MKKIITFLLISLSTYGISRAEQKRDFIPMAKGDTLAIFLTVPPPSNQGFDVYRKGPLPTNDDFVKLTKEAPIMPVVDPELAKSILGDEWKTIAKAVESDDPFEVLRKLRGSEFISGVMSLLSPKVATVTGRWFVDGSVRNGKEYQYKIVYVDARGNGKDSLSKQVTISETNPNRPKNVKVKIGDTKATVTWDYQKWNGTFDDLAIQFYIFRNEGTGEFKRVNDKTILRDDATPRQFVDLWLTNGQSYSYYVAAVDPIGRISEPSDTVKIAPKDTTAPGVPKNLAVNPGDGFMAISWDMSPELDVNGYDVYRSLGLDKEYSKINRTLVPASTPIYFDSTITNGLQYFYKISALDKSGNESEKCNSKSGVPIDKTPPDPPTNVAYKIEKRVLHLSWIPAKAKDVVGYHIYRGESQKDQPRLTPDPFKGTAFVDSGYQGSGMTPGKTFIVGVTAVDGARNESEKVMLTIVVPDDDPPLPPRGFIAKNKDGRYVEISCAGSPSIDAVSYKLIKQTGESEKLELATFSKAPFDFEDTLITKGKSQIYYAVAYDSAGNKSGPSKIDTVLVRDYSPPPSPRNASASFTTNGIELSWERVIDFDLAGYNIYSAKTPSGTYTKLNSAPLKDLKFVDAKGSKEIYYRVRAVDTSGNESTRGDAIRAK